MTTPKAHAQDVPQGLLVVGNPLVDMREVVRDSTEYSYMFSRVDIESFKKVSDLKKIPNSIKKISKTIIAKMLLV